MRLAHWEPCEAPSDEVFEELVQLCEVVTCNEDDIEGVLEIFVHPSGQYALSRIAIGGGWDWSFARLDRRVMERRATKVVSRTETGRREIRSDRRKVHEDFTHFIKTYGNRESDD